MYVVSGKVGFLSFKGEIYLVVEKVVMVVFMQGNVIVEVKQYVFVNVVGVQIKVMNGMIELYVLGMVMFKGVGYWFVGLGGVGVDNSFVSGNLKGCGVQESSVVVNGVGLVLC